MSESRAAQSVEFPTLLKVIAGLLLIPVFIACLPLLLLAFMGACVWEIFTGDEGPLDWLAGLLDDRRAAGSSPADRGAL